MDEELNNQKSEIDKETQQIVKEIATLNNKPLIDIKISQLAGWCLIVQLQAAARHPANTSFTAKESRDIALEIHSRLKLPPTLEQITQRGWFTAYDAKPSESVEEYRYRVPKREIIEVYNVYAAYSLKNNQEKVLLKDERPSNWGDKECWTYKQFDFECIQEEKHFINHVYCWYNPKQILEESVFLTFAQSIPMIEIPGKPRQMCDNKYLANQELWYKEWGEMPPFYLPDEFFE